MKQRTSRRCLAAVLAAGLAMLPVVARAAADPPPEVDRAAVAAAGRKTAAALAATPAKWTVSNTLASGAVIHVSVTRSGDRELIVFDLERGGGGGRAELLRIVSRDGLWYATDATGGARKCRPFELPAQTPFIYICLARAEPLFVTDAGELAADEVRSVEGDVVTFRRSLAPATARQMQAVVDGLARAARESGRAPSPAEAEQVAMMTDLLANGLPLRVHRGTGQMLEFGAPRLRSRATVVRFLTRVADAEFAADGGRDWDDFSDDPTAGDLGDLVMIGHQPGVGPDVKNRDLDGRLLDVRTGRFRRIPFPGGVAMPGCFLPGRREAVVTGLDPDTGALRPYRIDLSTRECRPLGGAAFESGFALLPDVSPDGKTLAVGRRSMEDPLRAQVHLVDLETDEARPLGEPLDAASVNWTADGRHLVLVDREHPDPKKPAVGWVATMDMRGTVTRLRRGDHPLLLADRRTILFEDPDTRLLHTCDLRGRDVKLFAGGMKGYGFPAPAPDGKRILMMRFKPGALPDPVVLDIGETSGRVVSDAGGLWGLPAWR